MDIVCIQLLVEGRVQGVGFRWSLQAEAERLGLRGWVRNRRDGSVEALACGPAEGIAQLSVWAHAGPPSARVDRVCVNDQPCPADLPDRFETRPTL